MPRVLIIGDVHLSDKAPSIRTDTYATDILVKLVEACAIAAEQKVDCIVLAGDVFHRKAPSLTSHKLVQSAAGVLTFYPIPVLIVPGNHDLSYNRLDSLNKQPLGTLVLTEGIDLLIGRSVRFPWLFGVPYLADWSELPTWSQMWEKSVSELVVTHAPIFPAGETPPYDYISAGDWAKLFPGHTYFGHIHNPNGVWTEKSTTFCNNGAISRGSLHEETLKRKPAVTVWDSVSGFMTIPLTRVKPVEEVFLLAEKEDVDLKQEKTAEFLEKIGSTELTVVGPEEVVAHAETLDLKPGTMQVIRECVESVSAK